MYSTFLDSELADELLHMGLAEREICLRKVQENPYYGVLLTFVEFGWPSHLLFLGL